MNCSIRSREGAANWSIPRSGLVTGTLPRDLSPRCRCCRRRLAPLPAGRLRARRGEKLSGTLLILKARVRPQIHRVFAVRVLICATIRHPPSCHDEISTGQADIAHLMQAVTTPREGTGFCRRNGFQRASIASESELQSELNQTRKIDCARDEPES